MFPETVLVFPATVLVFPETVTDSNINTNQGYCFPATVNKKYGDIKV